MDEIIYKITDYYELLNLHKALLEAKFHMNPDNEFVSFSPIVANITNRIVDILSQYDEDKNRKLSWEDWRKFENQPFYKERILINSKYVHNWNDFSYYDKVSCVKNLISPFVATDSEINDMIEKIEILHKTI